MLGSRKPPVCGARGVTTEAVRTDNCPGRVRLQATVQRGDEAGNVSAVELREDWKAGTGDAACDFGLTEERENI